jgi:hypothetical protein
MLLNKDPIQKPDWMLVEACIFLLIIVACTASILVPDAIHQIIQILEAYIPSSLGKEGFKICPFSLG